MSEQMNFTSIFAPSAPPPSFVEKKELKEYIRKDDFKIGRELRWATPVEYTYNWRGKRKFVRFGKPILQYMDARYGEKNWYDVPNAHEYIVRHVY